MVVVVVVVVVVVTTLGAPIGILLSTTADSVSGYVCAHDARAG